MGHRLRKLAFFIFAAVAVAGVLLLAAPLFVPAGLYKDKVIAKIEQSTGRKLDIRGDIGLRFVPRVQLSMGDVHMSNPSGFTSTGQEDMISLQEFRLSLSFFDLLRGKITIHSLQLIDPVIYLARDARGKANWVFTPETKPAADTTADKTEKDAQFSHGLNMPNMEIVNGTVIYSAKPKAEPVTFSNLNARIKMPSLEDQLTIYADTRVNDTLPANASLHVNTLAKWLANEETEYRFEMTLGDTLLKLTSEGKADPVSDLTRGLAVRGDARLAITSIKDLSAGLGHPVLQHVEKEGKISLRSMFNYENKQARLLGTTLMIDGAAISGSGSLSLSGSRPKITADLTTNDTVVLDTFLSKPDTSISRQQESSAEVKADSPKESSEPLLEDVSVLKKADVDLSVKIGGVKAQKVELGAMKIAAVLHNGTLNLTFPSFGFYGGKAASDVTIQAQGGNSLRIRKNTTITKADLGKFLQDAYGFDRLSGQGSLKMAVNTQGVSMEDFIGRLSGSGNFALQNGAIKGFNLAEVVRDARAIVKTVQEKAITEDMGSSSTPAQTDFSSLNGSYTIVQGIVTNPDLTLKAPLLNVTGSGTVNLPLQTVDYRLKPTLVGSIEGEGRVQETRGGLTIPLRVSGSFDQLKFTPDTQGIVQELVTDPKGTVEGFEDNVRGLRDDVKSLFKGL